MADDPYAEQPPRGDYGRPDDRDSYRRDSLPPPSRSVAPPPPPRPRNAPVRSGPPPPHTPLISLTHTSTHTHMQVPEPSNVLGVFGLSIRTVDRDLYELFDGHGRRSVEKALVVYDKRVRHVTPLPACWNAY